MKVIAWDSARVSHALGVSGPEGLHFTGVSTDTRGLTGGELFVALKGERFDAHDFLAQARAQGAAGAVVRRGTPPVAGLPRFEVEDTLDALGRLARARRRLLPAASPVVAITGSSGKTSTKEMVRAALATRYRVHATSGNLNNLVGVPLTILAAAEDRNALVVEVGASVPGEIARLLAIVEPTIAVVTNVTPAHLEGFGSLDGVLREKLALLEGVPLAVVGTEPTALAAEARRRTRTVVGSMLELGAESARLHAAAATEIVALRPALVAAVGAFVPALEAHRAALGGRLVVAADAEALGPALRAALRGDEVVLLKASRGVALERVLRFLN